MKLVDETCGFCHGSLATATKVPVDRHGQLEGLQAISDNQAARLSAVMT